MSYPPKIRDTFDKNLIMSRILTKDDYVIIANDTYRHFSIDDKVVCFFNGFGWNVIKLADMLAYPILYFDFWSSKDNTTYGNSLVVCPITMRSMIYKGLIQIIDVLGNRLLLLNTDTNDEFLMDLPFTGYHDEKGAKKKIKSHVKRYEVLVMTLRDAFMYLVDPKYIVVKDKERTIIHENYYTNRYNHLGNSIHTHYHPKTIVYMVQYYSRSTNDYKYVVLVGQDIDKDKPTGYSQKTNKVMQYISQHKNEFIEKRAYIYPIFWFMIDVLYKNVKMIFVV
jgi:hypothetical protein